MPFIDNFSEEDLKKKQEEQQAPTTQQSTVLGAGGQTSMATGSGKGSGWTNLQTYLENNAGQGVQTTQKILDVKQDQIKGAVDDLNKEVNDTKSKAQQGMVQRNTDLENQIKSNPTAVNQDAFSQYVSKSYAGPNQYTPGLETEKKWNGLQTKTTLPEVADPTKIGQQLKKDNYTYGLGKLDSYLIQGEGGKTVEDFNARNANVAGNRASQIQSVNDAINQAKRDSAANVGYAKSAVGEARQAAVGGISSRQAQVDQKNAELKKEADVLDYIINSVAKTANKQIDPAKIFAQNNQYGLGDVTSAEDRARIAALNSLIADDEDVDLNSYKAGAPGLKLSDEAIRAGLGYKYDPVNNTLIALTTDGKNAMNLTNDPFYKKLIQDALKAKGY